MYYDDHEPPHFHAEYAGNEAKFDFQGARIEGSLESKTATKFVRKWARLHQSELAQDWQLAREDKRLAKIEPLTR